MVFVKNISLSIVTIPVPQTSLKIWFNILKPNTLRFDITLFMSWLRMAFSLLSLSTLMIKRLISSLNPWMVDALNSCAKTLVLSLWSDPLFFFHASALLVFMLCLFICLSLCFVLSFFFFLIIKKGNFRKIQKQCVFVYTSTYVPWMAFETEFLNFVSLVV